MIVPTPSTVQSKPAASFIGGPHFGGKKFGRTSALAAGGADAREHAGEYPEISHGQSARQQTPCSRKERSGSRRVDAAKAVPHRGGAAGGQHRDHARVLIIAVERD